MYRFFEILPALLLWGTFLLLILLSFFTPALVAIFVILFDIYWFLKIAYLMILLRVSHLKMQKSLKTNWLEELQISKETKNNWSGIYHLVIFPMYNEPLEVVRDSFVRLARANYPLDKFIVVLATEGRAGEEAQKTANQILEEFDHKFFKVISTTHPFGLPGEVPGKGSNTTWAAKEAKNFIDEVGLDYEKIIVSTFDIDTQVFPEYFGNLTYKFLTTADRQRASFQPVPFFDNNIFEAPAFARMVAYSTTFWSMMQQSRPEQQVTFSSHSMPFKALVEVGFWQTDVVSEDSRIFWQCLVHYGGNYRVVPLFYPVSMDANSAHSFWQTVKNIYKQQRRWGYGAENIAYILHSFLFDSRTKVMSFGKKVFWSLTSIEGFHSWATTSFIIFGLGWLPIFLGGERFSHTLLSYSFPQIASFIMNISTFGIVTVAILAIIMLPPTPAWFRKRHYVLYALQWVAFPIVAIFLSSIPAIEAQTRLALGGKFRLGFWVTPKNREKGRENR